MGRRGPPPTPTAIINARGGWRGKARTAEPEMPEIAPVCPTCLSVRAREHWEAIVPLLVGSRVLRQTDGPALAQYCTLWARWRETAEWIDKNGTHGESRMQVKDENGNLEYEADGITIKTEVIGVVEWPQVKREVRYIAELTRLGDRFGLSPSARAAIGNAAAAAPKPEAGKGRFFVKG